MIRELIGAFGAGLAPACALRRPAAIDTEAFHPEARVEPPVHVFGNRNDIAARRTAEDLAPFRLLVAAVREAALERRTPSAD